MKIIKQLELEGTERDVSPTGCKSLRYLVASDGLGFSVHKTIIPKGGPNHWHYPHHLEACYCVRGKGLLVNLNTDDGFIIEPDTLYALDSNDDHTFQALEDTVLISVFNPPVSLGEVHDDNGNYPESEFKKSLVKRIIEVCNESGSNYDAFDKLMDII